MSAKIMGKVWDLDLPHNKLIVLLAMADHADHLGNNVFPSQGLIAWKTGYSVKQVRRIIQDLVKDEILVIVSRGKGLVTKYNIDLTKGKLKAEYTPDKMSDVTPPKMSQVEETGPAQNVPPTPDKMSHDLGQNSLKSADEPLTVIKPSIPKGSDERAAAALIKAWIDSSGAIVPNPYGNKGYRSHAMAMHKTGITPEDITGYITFAKRDKFYAGKAVPIGTVSLNIVAWKTSRQPAPAPTPLSQEEAPKPSIYGGYFQPKSEVAS